MRWPAALALALVAVTGCGDGAEPITTTSSMPAVGLASPADAVDRLFAVVSDAEGGLTAMLVPDEQLIAVLATENSLTAAETASLVRGGVPTELRDSYWRSFDESFVEFSGLPLDDLAVQQVVEFEVSGNSFAVVEVGFPTRIGSAYLVAAKQDPGGWHVDLVASLAPSLLGPIRSLVTALPDDDDRVTPTG